MAENKKSFIAYSDWKETFDALPDEKAGQLIKHIFAYVNDENPTTDDVLINAVFVNIRNTLKRDLKKWELQYSQRVNAGKKSAEVRKRNATLVNGRSVSSTVSDSVSVNVNEEKKQKEVKVYFPKSSEIDSAFKDYLKLRSTHKFTMTDRAINSLVKKLRELSGGEVKKALDMIDAAVVGKWKTFYSLDK
jgi:hypothetical protein